MNTVLYLSGAMTGRPDWNFPTFATEAKRLRDAGYLVLNPAENWNGATDVDRHLCMRLDLQEVLTADGLAVLNDWERSKGARLEVAVAREIGIPVLTVEQWLCCNPVRA